jgi:hypothetical protein
MVHDEALLMVGKIALLKASSTFARVKYTNHPEAGWQTASLTPGILL